MVYQGILEIPPVGHVSLCYINGKLKSAPPEEACVEDFTKAVSHFPDVNVPREIQRKTAVCADYHEVFRRVESSVLRRLIQTWIDEGFIAALEQAASPSVGPRWLRTVAGWAVSFTTSIRNIVGRISNPEESLRRRVILVTQVNDREESNVLAMDWSYAHNCLAVAARDDSVRIFSHLPLTQTPVLKCTRQQSVTCLAWRPLAERELAVGCMNGVVLWHVECKARAKRTMRVLQQPGHTAIASIAWSPTGDLLLTAASADPLVYVWDPDNERNTCLRQVLANGVGFVSWAPNYISVLVASTGFAFRIWDTEYWLCDRWTVPMGHLQSACWSAKGDVLLFATSHEACIYALVFPVEQQVGAVEMNGSLTSAHRVLDITASELVTGERRGFFALIFYGAYRIGGLVVSMAWDATSRFLAIIFEKCNLVIVYRTEISMVIGITPCCIVRGPTGQVPNVITFHPDFSEGALLTIAWSSGQVQYFPILEKAWMSPGSRERSEGELKMMSPPVRTPLDL